MSQENTEQSNTRPATEAEIEGYFIGSQKLWGCPRCGYEAEFFDALMVACEPCRTKRHTLVWMECRS
jgi:hypothetical protein